MQMSTGTIYIRYKDVSRGRRLSKLRNSIGRSEKSHFCDADGCDHHKFFQLSRRVTRSISRIRMRIEALGLSWLYLVAALLLCRSGPALAAHLTDDDEVIHMQQQPRHSRILRKRQRRGVLTSLLGRGIVRKPKGFNSSGASTRPPKELDTAPPRETKSPRGGRSVRRKGKRLV
jgi:hypothetical protein